MVQLRIYTKQDKAAFLNRCRGMGITLSTNDISSGSKGNLNYFTVRLSPRDETRIRSEFAGDRNFEIEDIREAIKKMIREELGRLKKK